MTSLSAAPANLLSRCFCLPWLVRCLAGLIVVCAAMPASAADRFWINPSGGLYPTTANWSATTGGGGGATVPGENDVARFQLNTTYQVGFFTHSPTNQALRVENGDVTFDMNNQTYILTNEAAINVGVTSGQTGQLTIRNGTLRRFAGDSISSIIIGSNGGTGIMTLGDGATLGGIVLTERSNMYVGHGSTGTFIVDSNGRAFVSYFWLGSGHGGNGTMTITGALARFDSTSGGTVGLNESGVFNVDGGAQATLEGSLVIGYFPSGQGDVNITGVGSRVITNDEIVVGREGYGSFNVTQEGNAHSSGTVLIGSASTGVGKATVAGAGSRWTQTGAMTIGNEGRGLLAISNGGYVTTAGSATIGDSSSGQGIVNVSGSGSRWDVDNTLTVGNIGAGTLHITDGGVVASNSALVGFKESGTVGQVVVTGADSRWTVANNLSIADLGTGTISAVNDGRIEVGGNLIINNPTGDPIGTVHLDGGTVDVTGNFTNNGVLDLRDGLLRVRGTFQPNATPGAFTINGTDFDDLPTVELYGSATTTNVTTLTVGNNRRGELIVRDGRNLSAGANAINVGALAGGEGVINVVGGGNFGTGGGGSLNVGGAGTTAGGTGTINIASGGWVDVGTLRLHAGGTINLNGGTLSFDVLGPINGTLNWSSGTVRFDAATQTIDSPIALKFFGPDRTLRAGRTLTGLNALSFATPVAVDGGSLTATTLSFTNNAALEIRSGVAAASGTVNNSGSIVLANSLAQLSAATLNNSGVLRGTGLVHASLNNSTSGQVQVTAGQRLQIEAASHTNAGQISVIGGEIDVAGAVTNSASTGIITARDAILRFRDGVVNNGSLAFSNGTVDFYGDIQQNVGGRITVSGGGIANFYDDVNLAEGAANVQVTALGSTVSKAVFFGSYNGGESGGGQSFIEGDHRPGHSPGVVTFAGDLFYGSFATLHIELGGTTQGVEYDHVQVAGQLALGGTLNVSLIDTKDGVFEPQAGQSFDILDWGSLAGTFDAIHLPILEGLEWNTSQLYTTGVLSVVAPGLPGDYNLNGVVDAADYVLFRKFHGTSNTLPNDPIGGTIGTAQYDTWQTNFGAANSAGSGSAIVPVPEPATGALLLLGLVTLLASQSRARTIAAFQESTGSSVGGSVGEVGFAKRQGTAADRFTHPRGCTGT